MPLVYGIIYQISRLLASQTSLFVIIVGAFAFVWPEMFAWVRGDVQSALLGSIMLTMGMTLRGQDFKALLQQPRHLFLGTCAQFGIMPLLAWFLVEAFDLPRGIAAGLILVGCCPGGVSSNIMSFLCKGDVAFSVGMTTVSTVLAPMVTPLLVLWLAGESIDVDAWGMFRSILLVTILPVAIGTLGNACWGKRSGYQALCKVMPGVSVLGLACIVGGVISACGSRFLESGLLIFVTIFLHNSLGYVLGYVAGRATRMNRSRRRTLSIEVGMQNAGLATVLAGKHFPMLPEAAVASAICCVWHSVTGTFMAGIFNMLDKLRRSESELDEDVAAVQEEANKPSK